MGTPGRIRVIGSVFAAPLCDTSEARIIEFYDSNDELMALLTRTLTDGLWGLVTRNDEDWNETLIINGYINNLALKR